MTETERERETERFHLKSIMYQSFWISFSANIAPHNFYFSSRLIFRWLKISVDVKIVRPKWASTSGAAVASEIAHFRNNKTQNNSKFPKRKTFFFCIKNTKIMVLETWQQMVVVVVFFLLLSFSNIYFGNCWNEFNRNSKSKSSPNRMKFSVFFFSAIQLISSISSGTLFIEIKNNIVPFQIWWRPFAFKKVISQDCQ